MVKIIRTKDEIYKAVSQYYSKDRIEKWNFIKRLKAITAILEGEETISENAEWVWVTELIEFYSTATPAEIKAVKKGIREDFKGILLLLDIKTNRNELIDLREE